MKPMSFAYWRKHWRHILRPYFRIRPCRFEQTRLRGKRWRYRKSLKAKYSALGRPPPALPAGLHGPITGLQWRQPQLRFRLPPPRRPRAPPQYISSSVAPQSNPSLKLHSVSHQEREPWPNFLGWLQYSCWCPMLLSRLQRSKRKDGTHAGALQNFETAYPEGSADKGRVRSVATLLRGCEEEAWQ